MGGGGAKPPEGSDDIAVEKQASKLKDWKKGREKKKKESKQERWKSCACTSYTKIELKGKKYAFSPTKNKAGLSAQCHEQRPPVSDTIQTQKII